MPFQIRNCASWEILEIKLDNVHYNVSKQHILFSSKRYLLICTFSCFGFELSSLIDCIRKPPRRLKLNNMFFILRWFSREACKYVSLRMAHINCMYLRKYQKPKFFPKMFMHWKVTMKPKNAKEVLIEGGQVDPWWLHLRWWFWLFLFWMRHQQYCIHLHSMSINFSHIRYETNDNKL